jgi:hypothetical protein
MLRQGFGQRRRAGCCSAVNGNDDWVHVRGLSAGSCRVLFAILQSTGRLGKHVQLVALSLDWKGFF